MDGSVKNRVWKDIAAAVLIAAAVVFVFGRSIYFGWVLDDFYVIVKNPYLSSWWNIIDFFTKDMWSVSGVGEKGFMYRPIVLSSYLALAKILGVKPLYFHLWNLLIHIANSILLFFVLKHISKSTAAALCISIFVSTHALITEAVVWISDLHDLYAVLFPLILFCIILYAKQFDFLTVVLCICLNFLSILTRENNIFIWISILLLVFQYRIIEKREDVKKFSYRLFFSGIFASVFLYLFLRRMVIGSTLPSLKILNLKLLCDFCVLWLIFIKNLILPYPLKFHRPLTLVDISIYEIISFIFMTLVFIGISLRRFFKDKNLYVVFAFTLIVCPLIPVAIYVAGATDIAADRYFYIPLFGVGILLAALFPTFKTNWKKVFLSLISCMAFLNIAFLSPHYVSQWKDEVTLFSYAAAHPPVSYEMFYDIGLRFLYAGDLKRAEKFFKKSLKLRPDYLRALNNLGVTYLREKKYDKAYAVFKKVLSLEPEKARYWSNLGQVLLLQGKLPQALKCFEKALELDPDYKKAAYFVSEIKKRLQHSGR